MIDLLPGWDVVTLDKLRADEPGAITDGPFGSKLTSAHYSDEGARVVRLQNIGDGIYKPGDAFIPWDHYDTLRRHDVQPGDLLIASLGEDPPRACLAPEHLGPAIVKADCIRVRLTDGVERRWVMYAMQSPALRKWAAEQLHGVGRPRLGLKTIRALPIPLPSLDEQRRIVELLEDQLSRLDATRGYLTAAENRTASLRTGGFAHALADYPHEERQLADLLLQPISNGRSVPTRVGGFPVLRLTAIKSGGVDLAERKGGAWTSGEATPFLVKRGDFLVARGNGSLRLVGRGALVGPVHESVAFPDTVMRIRVDDRLIEAGFLSLVWQSPWVRKQIESQARTTAGIYKINQQHLSGLRLPVPSLEHQRRIVARVQDINRSADRLLDAASEGLLRGRILRRTLLDAAFSGRLTGRNLDAEVAEEFAVHVHVLA